MKEKIKKFLKIKSIKDIQFKGDKNWEMYIFVIVSVLCVAIISLFNHSFESKLVTGLVGFQSLIILQLIDFDYLNKKNKNK